MSKPEQNYTLLISGGYRPTDHNYVKYLVSIRIYEHPQFFGHSHICGGSILTPSMVLTAAHCVWNNEINQTWPMGLLRIVAGAKNRLELTDYTQVKAVSNINVHPRNTAPKVGKYCETVGWGTIFYRGPDAANALYANVTILNPKVCKNHYREFTAGMLCGGNSQDPESDPCQGDSGGPLICDERVVGVVSFGKGCGEIAGVYMDGWYYRSWILRGVGTYNPIDMLKVILLPLLVWIIN